MRILVDYRPALRERTGVGEYVHQAATALVATAPPGETLTLFSASLRDRLAPNAVPGANALDRAIPVRLLNFLWHRLEWPPVERLVAAGAAGAAGLVRSNLRWALAYNLAAVPLAAIGLVPPWLAAVGMSASSLYVVLRAQHFAGGK